MRKLFTASVIGVIVLEIALVYFIMPFPGSQRIRSIDAAYLAYGWRWPLRGLLWALVVTTAWPAWKVGNWRRWLVPASLVLAAAVTYMVNYKMSADRIFLQPKTLSMQPSASNKVARDRLVVGIEINGDARAYPLQFIGYHHQVRDKVGRQDVLVTYCTVCRTGRVFTPEVKGRHETFRLVGMDHFNAMFEDESTGSWWRQANGEAITGSLKGTKLVEVPSRQVTLAQWLAMHPRSLVMQGDPAAAEEYSKDYAFERGTSRKKLTGTDTLSWRDKSWVLGVTMNGRSKAFDWNRLRRERVINDEVGGQPVVLALAYDTTSFFAFLRPDAQTRFSLRGDSLVSDGQAYALSGIGQSGELIAINVSQEFWHSWRTFQPATERY